MTNFNLAGIVNFDPAILKASCFYGNSNLRNSEHWKECDHFEVVRAKLVGNQATFSIKCLPREKV